MGRRSFLVIVLIAAVLATGCGRGVRPQPVAEQPVKTVVAGSGSNLLITRELAKAYAASTGHNITIPASLGSGGAINAVAAGELSLGLISRPLRQQEAAQGLKALPYARIAIVFASHSAVPDTNVSAADVLAILAGTKKSWADGTRIYVLVREKADSSNQRLYDLLPGYKDALFEAYQEDRWQVIYTDTEEADAVRRTPGSFGVVDSSCVAAAAGGIKPLAFEGVLPTEENVVSGRYIFVKDLAFVYKGELDKPVADFVAFAFSPAGREVIGRGGALPLGR